MTIRQGLAALLGIVLFASSLSAAEIKVSSAKEIEKALESAKPGDEIVMADGKWDKQRIKLKGKGTAEKPITLRAATPGKVMLTGESRVLIDGEYMVVSGLMFGDADSSDSVVDLAGHHNRLTETAIIAPNRGGPWIHFISGTHNRVDHCYFEGHAPREVKLQVEVEKDTPNEHLIDHNHFGPRPPLGANGGETIRIGYSHQSMFNSRTIVEHNLFERCDGEIEIISSKSCENIYRYNTFRNSEGCLTLRHGDRCVVDSNFFLGNGNDGKPSGGVRVIADGHTVTNNYFEGISGIAGGVIVLTAGQPKAELTGYWPIKKASIRNNIFINNPTACLNLSAGLGQKERSLLPQNVTVEGNVMLTPKADAHALVVGKEGEGFVWKGNLAQEGAEIGSAGSSGIKLADFKMIRGEDGIWRREGEKVSENKPLNIGDVGPAWRKEMAQTAQANAAGAVLATETESKSIELKNDSVVVRIDSNARKMTIRRAGTDAKGVQSAALCPEIVNAGGLAIRSAEYKDLLGTAQSAEFESEGGLQRVWIYKDLPFVFTRATLRDAGATEGDLRNVTPISFQLAGDTKTRLFGSDGPAEGGKNKASYVFIAAVAPNSNAGLVCGFITHDRASGIVDAKFADGGKITIDGRSEYGQPAMRGHKEERGETFVLGFFDDARLGLEQFADVTAKANEIKLPPVPCGYSTWYHARALDQERMAKLARFAKDQRLTEFGLNFLQIDDQWQIARRDFTSHKPSGPYPDGMKKTADTIKANGLFAGLWLTPFGWDSKLPLMKDHNDWFVHKPDGAVYEVKWAGDCLDMSHPQARDFLKEVIGRMTHEWGYQLLKIDGLWTGMACRILYPSPEYRDDDWGDAVFHDKTKTNEEVYRDGLKLVREAGGGKDLFLLGCNIAQNMRTMGASIGLVDAMRVGPDIKADWNAVVRCCKPATYLYFWNGRVWYNDPDCLMLRDPLTVENGRAWGSWIALTGQINLVSEWLPDLPAEKLNTYKRTIPNHKQLNARPLDLFDRDLARIWQLTSGDGENRQDVVGVFNWNAPPQATTKPAVATGQEEPTGEKQRNTRKGESGPITVKLDPAQLGLPTDAQLVGFDFWANEFIAPFSGPKELKLEPGTCKVISLHRQLDHPQVISTSRHVSQGIVDLAGVQWDAAKNVLRGKSKLVGGDDYELRIHAAGAQLSAAKLTKADSSDGVNVSQKQDGQNVRVTLKSPTSREVEWELTFSGGPAASR